MQTLQEKLFQTSRFLVGTELLSVRGSMAEANAIKARTFANELVASPEIDWISVTDNAGGNPQLAPLALGRPILYAGKEVVIHLTCKDLNRNGLESEAWLLHSEGFRNILAMTGDYPIAGHDGLAKPVFDIDSVGLIAMLNKMNGGFNWQGTRVGSKSQRLEKTQFCIGAVTTNFKLREGEVVPQYAKLEKKVECGAQFIINQIGFDARKISELRLYMDARGMKQTPLIGNVYLLSSRVAQIFHEGRIPGVVVSRALFELAQRHAQSPDGGKAFFSEFAAKQIAVYRGLGYRGVYLGGVHNFPAIANILAAEKTFAPDDWKQFAREIRFSRPGEFFYFAENPATGLADAANRQANPPAASRHVSAAYQLSKWSHDALFACGTTFAKWGAKICADAKDPRQGPPPLRALEHLSKAALYGCKDCGDCSLPDIAYLCPESQCAKNQRNGPCGGTREGRCEVDGYGDCIWLRAYERLKHDGREEDLLKHSPVVQDQGLRGTSAWANHWLGRDHAAKKNINSLRAFSLIELLVVIAVIGILAALLLAALSAAKGRTGSTTCMNNLKQINLAVHLYAADNGDKSPDTGPATYLNYREAVKSYVGLNAPSSPQDKVFTCPADFFYYDETTTAYVPHGRHEQIVYYYSSYMFNGLNLLNTNYPNSAYNGALPGIGGQKLGVVKNPARTVLAGEAPAFLPYSWHQPKPPASGGIPMFNDAKDMLSFVDGHTSFLNIYWNSTLRYPNGLFSVAAYYDPPAGYDYQWSGN